MKAIPKIERALGTIAAPASKSYTARALLLAAMTQGTTRVVHALDCDDSRTMLEAIRKIGYDVSGDFKSGVAIGERVGMSANEVEIDVGNAGTAMRFLAGFLSFTPGRYLLHGDSRMHERPIGDLAQALLGMGVELEYAEREGFPPLRKIGRASCRERV
jgi:5-enolpyruvylshikimate-3-phosphate synthase